MLQIGGDDYREAGPGRGGRDPGVGDVIWEGKKCQPGAASHLFFLVENRSESHSSRSPAAERNDATLVLGPEEERSIMQT